MPEQPNTQSRRIGSYQAACELLGAQRYRADSKPPPKSVQFGHTDDWLEQTRRVVARGRALLDLVKAYPLDGLPGRPSVIAEFAAVLALQRKGRHLAPADQHSRLAYKERANLQWILWGDLVVAPAGHLAIGELTISPWPGADSALEAASTPFHGISSEVLRTIRPQQLIDGILASLNTLHDWHRLAEQHGLHAPEHQRRQLKQTIARAQAAHRHGQKYPDAHYRDIALLYLDLLKQGQNRQIVVKLAEQLTIRPETARDWVRRARELGYLTRSQQGRPGALPGPRLRQDSEHP